MTYCGDVGREWGTIASKGAGCGVYMRYVRTLLPFSGQLWFFVSWWRMEYDDGDGDGDGDG